jgi:dihydrofolate reductase
MSINQLSAVVAVSQSGVIGRNNTLPWRLRSDLQRFKRLTMGHALIMGRKTFESIGKPLPGRQTIVLSRQKNWDFPGVCIVPSIDEALRQITGGKIGFVVGGAEIYRISMPKITNLYLTKVLADVAGDATFVPWNDSGFQCIERAYVPADEFNEWPSEFMHMKKASEKK